MRRVFAYSIMLGAGFIAIGLSAREIPSPEKAKDPSAANKNAVCMTYPLEDGFKERSRIILEGLADGSLDKWRKGYFSAGDPGKYLPGHAMAKLMLKPDDPEPAKYMNDDRSFKEHYHFAAVNWARFLPIFKDVLAPETFSKLSAEAGKYASYLNHGGTENHKTMWWTSANVLPYYIQGKFSGKDHDEALAMAKSKLKEYVKGLYAAGQGEWDSSTYLIFDVNGMLNIYDFSKDEECRLLAKAALDWFTTAYALKYRDGLFCAPHQRGFASHSYESPMDQTGYLWWGGDRKLTAQDCKDFRYAIHAITSSYRPNKVITAIAGKKLSGLPAEQLNTKANYWHGQGIPWKAGTYHESFYLGESYSLGSLWDGHCSQITRFQIAASSPDGAISFNGGSPRRSDHMGVKIDFGYEDGIGRYDQSVQAGPVYISMSLIPDGEELSYSFFSIPEGRQPKMSGEWFIFEIERTFVAVRPFGGKAEIGLTDLTEKQKKENDKNISKGNEPKYKPEAIIKISGRKVGFVVQTAEKPKFAGVEDLAKALEKTSLDFANIAEGKVTYIDIEGRKIEMKFNPDNGGDKHGDRMAECLINGKKVEPEKWDIYGGPFIEQKNGVMRASDGKDSFTIDFAGDMPVYK